jgi:hypothetical protein
VLEHFAGGVEIAAAVDERRLALLQALACGSATEIMACPASGSLTKRIAAGRATRHRKRPAAPSPRVDDGFVLAAGKQPHAVVAQMLKGIDAARLGECFGAGSQFGDGRQWRPPEGDMQR